MRTILVGEIGINHGGDIEMVKKLIDAAVLGGCAYVKFQKRDIDLVYTKEELDAPRQSPWGTTNRQQKAGLEFGLADYKTIDRYCLDKGIGWFGSPWDVNSVEFLAQFNPPFIKIASALLTNLPVLKKISETDIPVIIATGMSSKEEIDFCLNLLGSQVKYILSCTSSYPTPIKDVNLSRLLTLQKTYPKYAIGYSNHHPGINFVCAAAVLGAKMIEYHITLDRASYGSDQAASIEVPGMLKIKDFVGTIEAGWGSGSIGCLESEIPIRKKLRK
jgi:N-acetylneuraminate synthase